MNSYIRLWILGLGYPPPTALTGRGPDPHHLIVGSDPTYHFKADRVRILLLIKVMRICDHWSKDPSGLHFEPLKAPEF
jgi:hypothetical protein